MDELRGVEAGARSVRIGAGTTHTAVGADKQIRRSVPLLHRATPLIGHFQIRNRGTIGGAIAHADAAAEYPAVALTLDADIEVLSPRGERTVAATDFFTGMWTTALEPDEMVTAIRFPVRSGRSGFAIEEFARRSGDFAMAGATVGIGLDGDSRIDRCAIGLFGLAPTPVRAGAAEAAALGRPADAVSAAEIGAVATDGLTSISSDVHGSADYRRRLGTAMVARAWRRAMEEASND